jgi:outer membrane protein OmpA-like peptidoglycan-associated protein
MKTPFLVSVLMIALGSQSAIAGDPWESDQGSAQKADLYFDTNSASVEDGEASEKLKAIAEWARCHPKQAVILEGFADPRGTQKYNVGLSARRAVAVRSKLIEMGVRPTQLVIAVYGEAEAKEGQPFAKDRRVTASIVVEPLEASQLGEG